MDHLMILWVGMKKTERGSMFSLRDKFCFCVERGRGQAPELDLAGYI